MVDDLSFDEYRTKLLKRYSKDKKFKIKGSWGSKFIYRSVDKNHPLKKVSECDFLHIVRTVNNYIVEEILEGKAASIPYIGIFYIDKHELATYLNKQNKIVTEKKVDWYSTHKLWYTDEEARNNKILIRYNEDCLYKISWSKGKFNNKIFFKFAPMRAFKLRLKSQAKDNKDLFIYGKH